VGLTGTPPARTCTGACGKTGADRPAFYDQGPVTNRHLSRARSDVGGKPPTRPRSSPGHDLPRGAVSGPRCAGNVIGRGNMRGTDRRVFESLRETLASAGATFADLTKIHGLHDKAGVPREIGESAPATIAQPPRRARSCRGEPRGSGLPREIEGIAYRPRIPEAFQRPYPPAGDVSPRGQ